jgi:hypothetical protein
LCGRIVTKAPKLGREPRVGFASKPLDLPSHAAVDFRFDV